MEYIIIGICIIVIAAIGVGIFLKFKSKTAEEPLISVTSKDKADIPLSVPQDKPAHDLIIQVEMLPAEMISDESGLVEITDSKVLARVNALVPGLAQVGNAAMQSRLPKSTAKFYTERLFPQEQNSRIPEEWKVPFVVFIVVQTASRDMQI